MPWALEAVLADIGDVDAILFGGDLVAGPYPRRTLELARTVDALSIRGNAERDPSAWDRAQLDARSLRELAELPMTASLDGVLYCHAAPDDDMPITTIFTPDDTLLGRFGAGTTVIGHTHHQFDRRVGDVRVVNAGSVGMAYEGQVAAFWCLVEDGEPSFRHSHFDVERAIAEVDASGWPRAAEFADEALRVAITREEAASALEAR
jgi:predicted phosphodiesterase